MTDDEKAYKIAEWADDWIATFTRVPDYPHDLNATMRAARRLPKDEMHIIIQALIKGFYDDPARAAFDALSAYLENSGLHR